MNLALVIVPTYNEGENVERIGAAIRSACPAADVLFVDDDSPDGTGALLDGLHARDPRIHVLHRERKLGLGTAYVAGFRWALEREYAFVFEMDADFSHDPQAVPELLNAARSFDVVLGSRYLGGVRVVNWPLGRLILSRLAGGYVQAITGLPFTDPTGGFRCYRRAVLERLDLGRMASNGYAFQIEMLHAAWLAGFTIKELPIIFVERHSGQSKMNGTIVREAVGMVWKLWVRAGFRRRPPVPRKEKA